MRILLTNDDGIHARGLQTLKTELSKLGGEVWVVAPDREQSATSHSLTLSQPLRVNELEDKVFSVQGTPTDCVMIAIRYLLKQNPDIILSGINHGPNLGDDVSYSGTVAAAIEGTMLGILSMAISLADWNPADFVVAAEVAAKLCKIVLQRGLPEDTYFNVNVPYVDRGNLCGVEITRLGKRIYRDAVVKKTDGRGNSFFWIGGKEPSWEGGKKTDFKAIEANKISITPLHLDMTNYRAIDSLSGWDFSTLQEF
ncbi:5'/3'-nucleotidase SurE [bacterium]|nr:5'/3'-nucleotidase SurE [bacterium]MCK4596715.1 5'/3'-nucleotidase SurE [bacterium]